MTVLIILVAPIAGKASDRFGSRWLMTVGMTLGSSLLSTLQPRRIVLRNVLPGLLTGGVGMALAMSPMTAAALGAVPVDKAGVGSGILNTFRQVGGALGIAIMGAILTDRSVTALAAGASPEQAFMAGFTRSLYVGAGFAFAAAVVAALLVRTHHEPVRAPEEEPATA